MPLVYEYVTRITLHTCLPNYLPNTPCHQLGFANPQHQPPKTCIRTPPQPHVEQVKKSWLSSRPLEPNTTRLPIPRSTARFTIFASQSQRPVRRLRTHLTARLQLLHSTRYQMWHLSTTCQDSTYPLATWTSAGLQGVVGHGHDLICPVGEKMGPLGRGSDVDPFLRVC